VSLHDWDDLLEHVVSELMEDKSVNKHADSLLFVSPLHRCQLGKQGSIILIKGSTEDHIDRSPFHLTLKALLDDIWGKLQLTQPDKVSGNHAEDLVIAERIIKLQYILNEIVPIRIFNQAV
jgi:hypothetical protein